MFDSAAVLLIRTVVLLSSPNKSLHSCIAKNGSTEEVHSELKTPSNSVLRWDSQMKSRAKSNEAIFLLVHGG